MVLKNIFLVYVLYFVSGVLSISDEEVKMRFMKTAMSCTGEYPVSPEEILALQQYKIPSTGNGKCLLACACRKIGAENVITEYEGAANDGTAEMEIGAAQADPISVDGTVKNILTLFQRMIENIKPKSVHEINDKGMFDTANGVKIGKNLYGAEGGKADKAKDLVDTCKGVNDEPVTDGEKGCDRAALLVKCIVKNAKKAGLIIKLL